MPVRDGWYADRAPKLVGIGSGFVSPARLAGLPGGVGFNGGVLYNFPLDLVPTPSVTFSFWVDYGDIGVPDYTCDPTVGAFYQTSRAPSIVDSKACTRIQISPNFPSASPFGANISMNDSVGWVSGCTPSSYTTFPLTWANVLVSLNWASGVITRQMYVNDTQVINDSFTRNDVSLAHFVLR